MVSLVQILGIIYEKTNIDKLSRWECGNIMQ